LLEADDSCTHADLEREPEDGVEKQSYEGSADDAGDNRNGARCAQQDLPIGVSHPDLLQGSSCVIGG